MRYIREYTLEKYKNERICIDHMLCKTLGCENLMLKRNTKKDNMTIKRIKIKMRLMNY